MNTLLEKNTGHRCHLGIPVELHVIKVTYRYFRRYLPRELAILIIVH
jgi:hypothetical protein